MSEQSRVAPSSTTVRSVVSVCEGSATVPIYPSKISKSNVMATGSSAETSGPRALVCEPLVFRISGLDPLIFFNTDLVATKATTDTVEDVKRRLNTRLNLYIRRKFGPEAWAQVMFCMGGPVGTKSIDAIPWLIIGCPAGKTKKYVKRFLAKIDALSIYPPKDVSQIRFEVAVRAEILHLLMESSSPVSALLHSPSIGSPGIAINVMMDDHSYKRAIFGGFIAVTTVNGVEELYGLTAGYNFYNFEEDQISTKSHSTENEDSSSDEDTDTEAKATHPTQNTGGMNTHDVTIIDNKEDWYDIGTLDFSPEAKSYSLDRDWMLIRLVTTPTNFAPLSNCWPHLGSSLKVTEQSIQPTSPIACCYICIGSLQCPGLLSFNPVLMLLPFGKSFIRVFRMELFNTQRKQYTKYQLTCMIYLPSD